jgi:hypothetical protein
MTSNDIVTEEEQAAETLFIFHLPQTVDSVHRNYFVLR